ncbi:conserved hypothetical protein [Rhodopseudomonas palustris HaA2]|uniref:DUF459 domain-containing protein n=1 Tax=Rhodopseudomonas palustris (strain HaA2) TaxID=316058 RepID=Q2IRF1_RHOP2|nr:SGNH family hydrolase [Rhodopseudomonas palustris]ABD09209.1 conserved hypothetical protein [Rhodopseudomonas palustris HaA2]
MSDKPKSLLTALTRRGPLLAIMALLLVGVAGPASAQFFGFGGPSQPPPRPQRGIGNGGGGYNGGGGGFFGSDVFAPFQHQAPKRAPVREDYSRAPAPDKRDAALTPERNVVVLGDAMADWLAYGLEQAYAEQPDMGVIRKHKTVSGLLRYQPKGEPSDWIAAARDILAAENPDAIVVMLGLSDRVPITEPVAEKDKKKDGKGKPEDADAKPNAKPDDKTADGAADDDDEDDDTPQIMTPEKGKRSGVAQFRDDRWIELYTKKLEDMIAVLKTKGVPVLWVGLPAVRGTKSTSDAQFLNALYRDAAAKAGITYVDVWDGFVDEAGRYVLQGPDFEGQTRRLRAYDGVYFTKSGARKLAHYVEREIARLLAARSGPIALPTDPGTPDASAKPDGPAPRPIAGPIMPLVASSVSTERLLGGPGVAPAPVDALVARTLVKGEPLAAPAGRADDYAWPRREIVVERAQEPPPPKSAAPVASNAPGSAAPGASGQPQPQKRIARAAPPPPPAASGFFGFAPAQPQPQMRRAPPPPPPASGFFSIFR